MVALLRTTATLARCSIQLPSQAPRQCAAQESRLKPRLGPAAEAATARPFTGSRRAASSLAHFGRRGNLCLPPFAALCRPPAF